MLVCDKSGPCCVVTEISPHGHRVCPYLVLDCTLVYDSWNPSALSPRRFILCLVPLGLLLNRVLEYVHLLKPFAEHRWPKLSEFTVSFGDKTLLKPTRHAFCFILANISITCLSWYNVIFAGFAALCSHPFPTSVIAPPLPFFLFLPSHCSLQWVDFSSVLSN